MKIFKRKERKGENIASSKRRERKGENIEGSKRKERKGENLQGLILQMQQVVRRSFLLTLGDPVCPDITGGTGCRVPVSG